MKRKKQIRGYIKALTAIVVIAAICISFNFALNEVENSYGAEGSIKLEEALRKGAITCYSVEGVYPPSIDYLKENYGIQVDEENYTVFYEVFASNLMPEITVIERK